MRSRALRAVTTAVALATAASLAAPVAPASLGAPVAGGNPTGTRAGSSPNGAANLKVALTATADGRIKVSWRRPGGASSVLRYIVRVGPNRKLDSKVHSYRVPRTRTTLVVPRAYGVTPYSGNYSFVKVTVNRRGGRHGSSPTKFIQGPVVGCTTSDRIRVATFNVRTWHADRRDKPAFRWSRRGPRAVQQILASGASVVAVQEASGSPRAASHGLRQDRWLLARLNATDPDRSARWVDALAPDAYRGGLVGTRIFYDADKVTKLETGVNRISVPGNRLSVAPWARFRKVGGRTPFVFVSTHLAVGDSRAASRVRGRQAQALVTQARALRSRFGGQLILAGDLNSTAYTKPYNNVQVTLLRAGFYDAYAAPRIGGAAYPTTNNFDFPTNRTPLRRDYILTLGDVVGSCAFRNRAYVSARRVASDHFLQDADLPLS